MSKVYNTRSKTGKITPKKIIDYTNSDEDSSESENEIENKNEEIETKEDEKNDCKNEENKDDEKPKKKKFHGGNILFKLLIDTAKKNAKNNEDDNNENNDDDDEDYEDDEDDEDYEDDEEEEEDFIYLDEDEMKKAELLDTIENATLPINIKEILKNNIENSNDFGKVKEWVTNVMKIPFNKYVSLPVDLSSNKIDIITFFKNSKQILDNIIYGMDNAKEEIINYVAQFISNTNSKPRVLALQGPAGVGKTAFLRRGLSPILNRPIKCISMGGISDASTFNGFDYTYVGSKCGIISRSIIETGVMNPIIYMDEIDKISETSAGQDIMNFLIHITDPEQTATFEDKYFAGIPIDLSKVLFVFSYNDESRVSPILLDRLNIIRIASPTTKEKVVIARDYMLKDICKNVGISKDEIEITENAIRRIISTSDTHGMRDIKRKLETIVMKINTLKLTGGELNFSFNIKPKEITEEYLIKCPGKTKLKKMETRKKNIYIVDEDKVSKLLSERDDNTSYKMMFI